MLIFGHEPQENDEKSIFNGKGNTRYTNATYKALNAQRHGAVGILSMADPNQSRRGPRGAADAAERRPRHRPRIPSEALVEGGPAIPSFTISSQIAETSSPPPVKNPPPCRPPSTPVRARVLRHTEYTRRTAVPS